MIEVEKLHPFEVKVLLKIEKNKEYTIPELSSLTGLNESQTRNGVQWLADKNLIIETKIEIKNKLILTDKGKEFVSKPLIEEEIFRLLKEKNLKIPELMQILNQYEKKDIGSAIGNLKKRNEIKQGKDGTLIIEKIDNTYYEILKKLLKNLNKLSEILIDELPSDEIKIINEILKHPLHKNFFKTREQKIKYYKLTEEGERLKEEAKRKGVTGEEISQLTPELLTTKKWKEKKFRHYNIHLPGPHVQPGRKHPYREFLDYLKYKFVALGFKQMEGELVETEFWDMDALYMPQFHPAREIHDVYFVKEPEYAKEIKEPYLSNVAETHENGWKTGSKGWRYKYDKKRSKRLILRSQGTVLSARMLASNPEIPGKYFAIARCFRYDKVDATHLPDFYQVEGIVISETANFKTLLGLLSLFAKEIAKSKEIKFTPAYFPFTEPSVELHVKHPELGWYELGGAGIFRPEVTLPLGIDIPVIAWGLGIDRMAMMAMKFNDIRNLFTRDLDLIRGTRLFL